MIGHYNFIKVRRFIYSKLILFGISHSKDNLDQKILKQLNKKRNGFFIECGAADGITYSNSNLLEKKYGWKGMLIEPIQDQFDALKKYRKGAICEKYILSSQKESGRMVDIYDAGPESIIVQDELDNLSMSDQTRLKVLESRNAIKGIEKANTISISTLLDRHNIKHVDIFFLDVEGSELSVLQGWDEKRHSIDYLVIETGEIEVLSDYLKKKGISSYSNIARNDFLFYK